MPLEGLFWSLNKRILDLNDTDNWEWSFFIAQPDFITKKVVDAAIVEEKQKGELEGYEALKLQILNEGLSAQMMHIGPYSKVEPRVKKLYSCVEEQGYQFDGSAQKYHEIYISDPKITKFDDLKTIIRQPIKKA